MELLQLSQVQGTQRFTISLRESPNVKLVRLMQRMRFLFIRLNTCCFTMVVP